MSNTSAACLKGAREPLTSGSDGLDGATQVPLQKFAVARGPASFVLGCCLLISGCDWPGKLTKEAASARTDSLATRAFDDLAYEGSEVFLTMLPINIAAPEQAEREPQICIYEVNFLRQVIESNEQGSLRLLEDLARPINAFAFNAEDISSLTRAGDVAGEEPARRRFGPPVSRETSLKEASEAIRNILVGIGFSDDSLVCGILPGRGAPGPSAAPQGRFASLLASARRQLSERRRRENAAIFGPQAPLFARTLAETPVEPLHSGEYALILGRIKQLSLKHDLTAAAAQQGRAKNNASPERMLCFNHFRVQEHVHSLQEIVSAFPPARQIPDRPFEP